MTRQTHLLEPTNLQRAQWARNALAVFTAETYGGDHPDRMHPEDLESAIGDLICDLLHLARYHPRMDETAIHAHALAMFEQEVAGEMDCDCGDRSWYGKHHNSQCPVSLAGNARSGEDRTNDAAHALTRLLDALLNIKRLAQKSGDHEADPFALLDLISYEAQSALAKVTPK